MNLMIKSGLLGLTAVVVGCTSDPMVEGGEKNEEAEDSEDMTQSTDSDSDQSGDTETASASEMDTEPVYELCEIQETLDVLDGEYRIHNNVWGRNDGVGEQCISVQGNSFEVTQSTHNCQSVAAYPFFLKGCHLGGDCTKDSNMPIQVNAINSCDFQWKIDMSKADGIYNVAYESWFSETGGGQPTAELMIWVNYQGPSAIPSGTLEEEVEIGGHEWRVFRDIVYNWNYVAYIAKDRMSETDIDFTLFMDDAIERGALQPEWYLDAMEAGFEIWQDGTTLKTLSFSANVD